MRITPNTQTPNFSFLPRLTFFLDLLLEMVISQGIVKALARDTSESEQMSSSFPRRYFLGRFIFFSLSLTISRKL